MVASSRVVVRMGTTLVVVPANAGTHTPRQLGVAQASDTIFKQHPPRSMGPGSRPGRRAIVTVLHSRGTMRPRFARSLALIENRGLREDRVRAAPAVSCAIAHRKRAHEHTGSAGASRPSLRSGFTAYFVLSPVNGSFATVAPGKLVSQELDASTAASGPHDFAVRFTPHSSDMASASTASHRTFVTIAIAPLSGETRGIMPLICPTG